MDIGEVENYIKLGKPVYPVYLSQTKKRKDPEKDTYFIFRSKDAFAYFLHNIINLPRFYYSNFLFEDGIESLDGCEIYCNGNAYFDLNELAVWNSNSSNETNLSLLTPPEKMSDFSEEKQELFKSLVANIYKISEEDVSKMRWDDYFKSNDYSKFQFKPKGDYDLSNVSRGQKKDLDYHNYAQYVRYDNERELKVWYRGVSEFPWHYDLNGWINYLNSNYRDNFEEINYGHWLYRNRRGLNTESLIADLVKERHGKEYMKRVRFAKDNYEGTKKYEIPFVWLNNPLVKRDNDLPLASFKFNLYYTKEKIGKIRKFTVGQNDLPYPIIYINKWTDKYSRDPVKFFVDINKQDLINVLDFYGNALRKNTNYSNNISKDLNTLKQKEGRKP